MANTAQADVLLLGTRLAGVLTGVTSGTSLPINLKSYPLASFYLSVNGGTLSGGTIIIEQAWWDPVSGDLPYGGLWSQLQSIAASSLSGTQQQQAFNVGAIASGFARVRISSPLTGGGTLVVGMTYIGNS